MDVDSKVKKIIVDQLGSSENELIDTTRFIEDLSADSLDTVELVMALEKEFDIEIPEETPMNIQTVGAAINYVKSHTPSLRSTRNNQSRLK